MAKTKPIGVRFSDDFLQKLKEDGVADTYQKAVNFLEKLYLKNKELPPEKDNNYDLKNIDTHQPNPPVSDAKKVTDLKMDEPKKINVTTSGDPKEGSAGFMMKYGVLTYAEIENKQ